MHYNPWEDNSYSGMMKSAIKWGFGKKKKKKEGEVVKRKDDVHVQIFKTQTDDEVKAKKPREVLSTGTGSWLSHLMMDDEVLWRIQEEVPQWTERDDSGRMSNGNIILPSDTRTRSDIQPMIEKDWTEAEKNKH